MTLLGEGRVPTELEGLEPMGLDVGGLPDLPHLPLGDAGVPSHQPRAPMGGLHRYPFGRQEQDALDGSSGEDRRSPRPGAVHQAGETLGEIAAVPQVHGRPTDVQERGGIGGATAGIKGEQDARTTRLPAGRRWSSQPRFHGVPMVRAQLEVRGRLHDDHSTRIPLLVQVLYARNTSTPAPVLPSFRMNVPEPPPRMFYEKCGRDRPCSAAQLLLGSFAGGTKKPVVVDRLRSLEQERRQVHLSHARPT